MRTFRSTAFFSLIVLAWLGRSESTAGETVANPAPSRAGTGKSTELVPLPELSSASEKIKNLPLGPARFSFGLEQRTRLEVWDNKLLANSRTYTNGLVLFRERLWVDADLDPHVRLFAMGQDDRKDGDLKRIGRTEENHTDLLEGYVDFRKLFALDLTIRAGRQPLAYGRERLVGAAEWLNSPRRFDGLKLMWKSQDKHWAVDAFATKVVVSDPMRFDRSHPTEEFYGLYAVNKSLSQHTFDLYFLGRVNDNGRTKRFNRGKVAGDIIVDELRRDGDLGIYTLGFRANGEKVFEHLDYEVEAAVQRGHLGQGEHRAAATHVEAGWTFAPAWKPRLMAEFNFGSGDDNPRDGDSETFDNLFPSNHLHYGYMDYMNWSNTLNVALGFTAQPRTGVLVWAKAFQFWLAEEKDAWRNAGGAVLGRDATGRSGDEVGYEVNLGSRAQLNKHVQVEAGYSIFECGRFAKGARPSRTGELSQFCYFQAGFKF